MRSVPWRAAVSSLALLALVGCPKSKSGPDAGGDGGVDAGRVDGGGADAGIDAGLVCRIDDDCAVLQAGLRCADDGGCIPATGCQLSSNCTSLNDPSNYCYVGGPGCRCVTEPNDSGFPGVCRRRRPICSLCTDPSQCGNDSSIFSPVGTCKALSGDPSGDTFCLYALSGPSCGCGMIDDGSGYCRPQGNSCTVGGCSKDADCIGGQVCDTVSCLCETRCRWDFRTQQDSPQCPPGTICWADSANLAANSIFYGAGRCRPPCTGDAGCSDPNQDPFGGANLKCAPEVVGTGLSSDRCRANGQCMDDLECPMLPANQPDLGYCDRGTFQCKTDCRIGTDPTTGQPFRDCRAGFLCAADAGANACTPQTCAQLGGALADCTRSDYCCGEDIQGNGHPPPCLTDAGLGPDHCYPAAVPPFCTPCAIDSDCQSLPNPNGATLPSLCVQLAYKMNPVTASICAPGTFNDGTLDGAGVPRYERGCPAGYSVRFARALDPDPSYSGLADTCALDTDCDVGTDAGKCGRDPFHSLPDGGHPLACLCTQAGANAACPNDPDAGVVSVCSSLSAASPQICVTSLVCVPGSWAYQPSGPPNFGCGLN